MRTRAQLEALISTTQDSADRRVADLQEELAALEALPQEPSDEDGAVITWQQTFGVTSGPVHVGQRYTYAAVRVRDRWYLTAENRNGANLRMTWPELFAFMTRGGRLPQPTVWLASEWVDAQVGVES